jgi:hypothetical protein
LEVGVQANDNRAFLARIMAEGWKVVAKKHLR